MLSQPDRAFEASHLSSQRSPETLPAKCPPLSQASEFHVWYLRNKNFASVHNFAKHLLKQVTKPTRREGETDWDFSKRKNRV
jgi:hypothetical protein